MAELPDDYFERFVRELEGIHKEMIGLRDQMDPEKFAKAMSEQANFYQQGFSQKATRPEQPGEPAGMGPSAGATVGGVEAEARHMAGAQGRQPTDEEIASFQGQDRPSPEGRRPGQPSTPTPEEGQASQTLLEQARTNAGVNMLHLTEAQYTSQDYLRQAARLTAGGSDWMGSKGIPGGSALGGVAGAMQWTSNKMPQVALARSALQRSGVQIEPHQLEAQGAAMGVSPQGRAGLPTPFGNIDLGGIPGGSLFGLDKGQLDLPGTDIGIRLPYANPAANAAMKREFQIQMDRSQAGINGQQVRTIWDTLQEHGFTPQMGSKRSDLRPTPGFDEMRFGMEDLTKKHPEMLNPATFDQLDKAVRQGNASMKDFSTQMGRVSDVAARTGYSFSQLQQDMQQMGDLNVQQGGTNWAGQKKALDWQADFKGIPAASMVALSQNPLVQGTAFRETGLMPFQQGLATHGQQGNAMVDTVMQMYNSMALPAVSSKLGGAPGKMGFKNNVSQEDARIAQLHQVIPELSAAELKNMIHHQKTFRGRNDLRDATESWASTVRHIQGDKSKSKSQRNAEISQYLSLSPNHGDWGDIQTLMDKDHAHFSKKEKQQVKDAGSGKHGADLVAARAERISKILDKKDKTNRGESNQGNKTMVDLTPAAKKLLRIVKDPNEQNKEKAKAGMSLANESFAQGPTAVLDALL